MSSGKQVNVSDPAPYTRREFNAALRSLGKRQQWFADQVQLTYGTVAHWGLPGTPFPTWVPLLLAAWVSNQRLALQLAAASPALASRAIERVSATL